MTTNACEDRRKLRDAVVAYMNGSIRTFAFDDLNCEFMDSQDESVRRISKLLYQIHDDTVDHPISVSHTTWDAMARIVAFLDTDLAATTSTNTDYWPFKDDAECRTHCTGCDKINIPPYNPAVHALPIHGILNRIPTSVGFGIIALAIGLLIVGLIATR